MEKIIKFYSKDLAVRAAAAVTTELVRDVCSLQNASPAASIALGRCLTAAALMASQQKDGQRIGLRIMGDGPLGEIFVDASYEGKVRGYCQNPHADLPLKQGRVDVAGAVGQGVLAVTRAVPFQKQPHQGIVPLVTGEISQDLASYFKQSQQTPTMIALTVSLDPDGQVKAAGGVIVELMPGAEESIVQELEAKAQSNPKLSELLVLENPEIAMVRAYTHNSELVSVEHLHPIEFFCPCTMERVERTLSLLGRSALAEMALKGEPVQINCEFCQKQYVVDSAHLRKLLAELDA
jgi:molecular chaperone Hsp33